MIKNATIQLMKFPHLQRDNTDTLASRSRLEAEHTTNQLKNMPQTADKADEIRLKKACKDFEAIILNKLFSAMRKTVPEDGLFEKSFGEKIYQSMLDEELSKEIAHSRGMGLGELLFKQLTQNNR